MSDLIADRRLYLTADRERVVEHGNTDAGFLLVPAGRAIPSAAVKRYKLAQKSGKVVLPDAKPAKPEPQPEPEPEPEKPKPAASKKKAPAKKGPRAKKGKSK